MIRVKWDKCGQVFNNCVVTISVVKRTASGSYLLPTVFNFVTADWSSFICMEGFCLCKAFSRSRLDTVISLPRPVSSHTLFV